MALALVLSRVYGVEGIWAFLHDPFHDESVENADLQVVQ